MIEKTFILHTTREIFYVWLVRTWQPVTFSTSRGGETALASARRKDGRVTIDMAFATAPNAEDVSTANFAGWVIAFEAIPLDEHRIEVRAKCSTSDSQVQAAFYDLLAMIGARWPESGLAEELALAVIGDDESVASDDHVAIGKEYLALRTAEEISSDFGYSPSEIYRILERLGIERRKPGRRPKGNPS